MSLPRAQIKIRDNLDRALAKRWTDQCAVGTRIEFKAPQRNIAQNARMWAMLTDVSRQYAFDVLDADGCVVDRRKYKPAEWKVIFLAAFAEEQKLEIRHLPAIHRGGLIPVGRSSSDLSKQEMQAFIEWIYAWGAENGIVWSEPKKQQEAAA